MFTPERVTLKVMVLNWGNFVIFFFSALKSSLETFLIVIARGLLLACIGHGCC